MEVSFTIPQSVLIKDTVHSFWQVYRPNNPPLKETIIPKGVIEIIFSLETPQLYARMNNQTLTIPRCFVQGFHTCPVQLHLADKQTFFGVVLYPTAAKHILRLQPAELANCVVDLTLVDTSFYSLWHCLGEQKSFKGRVNTFTKWLIKKRPCLTDREKAFNKFLDIHTKIQLSVSEIARQFCYSPKQLSRKLHELTGMNTQQTLLYKKYLRAVHLIHSSKLSLTDIAYSSHFFDQSHFIKTFKTLSQLTPKKYRQKKSSIMGHILEDVH